MVGFARLILRFAAKVSCPAKRFDGRFDGIFDLRSRRLKGYRHRFTRAVGIQLSILKCTSAKPKDRQIERIALTVFSVGRLAPENALEGVIRSLFGTFLRSNERLAAPFSKEGIVDEYAS